jgi:predicted nucleic acid-binding protein
MKIAVKDANVFIDMESMGVFDLWAQLGYETLTTSLIVLELEDGGHAEALAYIETEAISVEDPSFDQVDRLYSALPGLSLEDASILCLTMERGAMLLTGDKTLRNAGAVRQVEVHGSIWVLDQLVRQGKLAGRVAAQKLQGLLDETGKSPRFLPRKEALQYIHRWRMG